MALAGTNRGSGGDSTSTNSWQFSPGSNFTLGSVAVAVLVCDNSATAGASPLPASFTDSAGHTWTSRVAVTRDPGLANEGVSLRIYDTIVVFPLSTSTVLTVALTNFTAAKAWQLIEFTAASGKVATFVTSGTGQAGTSNPSITTGSITSGDAVVGAAGFESDSAMTADSDTSNGNWSTAQTGTAGLTTTSNIESISQFKVVTATATQTYNITSAAADRVIAWAQYTEADAPAQTIALTPVSIPVTPQALAISAGGVSVAASPVSIPVTPQALAVAGAASLALSPVTVPVTPQALGVTPGGASVALTPVTVPVTPQALGVTGATSLALSPVSVAVAPQALGVSAATSLALTPVEIPVLAQALGVSPGGVSVALSPAEIQVAAQQLTTAAASSLALSPVEIPVAPQAMGLTPGGATPALSPVVIPVLAQLLVLSQGPPPPPGKGRASAGGPAGRASARVGRGTAVASRPTGRASAE